MEATSSHDSRPPWRWPRAAYVHIPFCAFHCGYCDFAVSVGQDQRIDEYIDVLTHEMSALGQPQSVQTLFFGGGTPTYLSPLQLESLLERVLHWLPLRSGHEFSVEANPGTLDADKIAVLARHRVNRVSLGAQSFSPKLLRVLERDHQPADVPRALDQIRKHIANVSLDLIFGVPGQTLADWEADLEKALALEPCHIATYGLTYEKGTRLWKQQQGGQVQSLDEDQELAMYTRAIDRLAAAGFEHYEISNFARPGFRCRHNQVYWANEAYFGFGMGAARYVEGVRQTNVRDLGGYLRRVREGRPTYFQSEELSPRDRALETVATQLRRADGIDRLAFRTQTSFDLDPLLGKALGQLIDLDLIADSGACVRLTRKGKCLADSVVASLLAAESTAESAEGAEL